MLRKRPCVALTLRDHRSGEIITSDIMARALYGELEGSALVEARNKVGKVMWSGANQERWQSVPGQLKQVDDYREFVRQAIAEKLEK